MKRDPTDKPPVRRSARKESSERYGIDVGKAGGTHVVVNGLPRPNLEQLGAILANCRKTTKPADRRPSASTAQSDSPAHASKPPRALKVDSYGRGAAELPARVVLELQSSHRENGPNASSLRSTLAAYNCTVEPLFDGATKRDGFRLADYVVVTLPVTRGQAGRAGHDIAYALLNLKGVRRASYEGAYPRFAALESALCPGDAPEDKSWALKAIRMPTSSSIGGAVGGTGIVIGHPDTGYTNHSELEPGLLDLTKQWSTLTQTADASDPMRFPLFKGHGTSTASVMASRPAGQITGVAPGATLIPIRCIESVAVVLDVELARAVWYACQQDVHVISMSAGGHPIAWLEGVVAHAIYAKSVIVCAAAGNATPYVVFPAAYPDCIAVASTTPTDRPAAASSYGPEVTIAAPGHKVWEADWVDGEAKVKAGCGTSYATPHVAGAAALWLHTHGRDALLQRYGKDVSLQEVFKLLLQRTARNPGVLAAPGETGDINRDLVYSWNTKQYGAGILDVEALLSEPLPDPAEASMVNPHDWAHTTWDEIMYGRFQDLDPQRIEARLHSFFVGVEADLATALDQFGAEVTQTLMDAEATYNSFRAHVASDVAIAGRGLASAGKSVEQAATQGVAWANHTMAAALESVSKASAAVNDALEQAGDQVDQATKDAAADAQAAVDEAAAVAEQIAQQAAAAAKAALQAAEDAAAAAAADVEGAVSTVVDTVSDTLKKVFGF